MSKRKVEDLEDLEDQMNELLYNCDDLKGRDLMNYINLYQKIKKIDPGVSEGYRLENNAVDTSNLANDDCSICLELFILDILLNMILFINSSLSETFDILIENINIC